MTLLGLVIGLKTQGSFGDDAVRKLHVPGGQLVTDALVVKKAKPAPSLGYCISLAPQYTQGKSPPVQYG